jgi:hypothetical protein
VFGTNQAIFQASQRGAGAIPIAFISRAAHAAGGGAARRPRKDAGAAIGSEL